MENGFTNCLILKNPVLKQEYSKKDLTIAFGSYVTLFLEIKPTYLNLILLIFKGNEWKMQTKQNSWVESKIDCVSK